MSIIWEEKPFDQLSAEQLYTILQLRIAVFMLEQNCLYPECDNKDFKAVHLMGKVEGKLVAYARILPPLVSYKEASIGRVLTHQDYRKFGYGKSLMEKAIALTTALFTAENIRISGQQYLEKFYNQLGFQTVSAAYLEDDIPHIEMFYEKLKVKDNL